MFFSKSLSITKLKLGLHRLARQFKASDSHNESIKNELYRLETLIQEKKKKEATALYNDLDKKSRTQFPKPMWKRLLEGVAGLAVALVLATVVRQMWFEPFQIPTGSMRPTFEELDLLTVTKTPFGINVPVQTEHFYFNDDYVQRGSSLIFSGDGLDLPDTETTFLYVFPYTKRYVKRLIGKPGDTLYFYGGSIYGFDKNGNKITDFENADWMKKLEYIPIITFEGKVQQTTGTSLKFKQMNEEIGKLTMTPFGEAQGEVFADGKWIKDDPNAKSEGPKTFSDLWGIGNYAKVRLLKDDKGYYLEFYHHPSFSKINLIQEGSGYKLALSPQKSTLRLDQEHLDRLKDNLYTARFVVENGRVTRYDANGARFNAKSPQLANIPDGTYEFYYGKGYKIGFGGLRSELPKDHPLMSHDAALTQNLYNYGIDFDLSVGSKNETIPLPTRFAYFRNGDLYILGAPIFKKDEQALAEFTAAEKKKGSLGFYDQTKPLDDPAFIKKYGIKVPDRHYLVLGDNHAMSGDSRIFGFVPEQNLQGAPSVILWPFGERLGTPNMKPYPLFTPSRIIVWIIGFSAIGAWYYIRHRRMNRPIKEIIE